MLECALLVFYFRWTSWMLCCFASWPCQFLAMEAMVLEAMDALYGNVGGGGPQSPRAPHAMGVSPKEVCGGRAFEPRCKPRRRSGSAWVSCLGPPVVPFYTFFGEGSPAKIDYRKEGYPYRHCGRPRADLQCCWQSSDCS